MFLVEETPTHLRSTMDQTQGYILRIRVRGAAISKAIQQTMVILSRRRIKIDRIIFEDKANLIEGSFLIQVQALATKIENIKDQINKILEVERVTIAKKQP